MSGARLQIGALARRSVVRTLRQPGAIYPALVFPLFFLAVVSAGARSAARLPGFPTDSYFKFYLAGSSWGHCWPGPTREPTWPSTSSRGS